jgi:hypothetical protein
MTRAAPSLRLFAVLAAFGAVAACASPAPGGFDLQPQQLQLKQQAPPNTFRG